MSERDLAEEAPTPQNRDMDEKAIHVGFIGLGDQGAPMARAIAEAGWPLHVWARRPQSLETLRGVPHTVCGSIDELARVCDIVALVLTDDADVRQILIERDLLENLRAGGIVVNHGTGDPETAVEFAALTNERGHAMLDAPVSGGRPAAEAKALTTFAGGDIDATERCRPVFDSFSTVVAHMGPPGSGQLTKLINNASLLANLRNAEDIVSMGQQFGLAPRQLVDVLQTGSGSSFALQFLAGPISSDMAKHVPALWRKDIGHFSDAIRERQLSPTVLEARAHESVEMFQAAFDVLSQSQQRSGSR